MTESHRPAQQRRTHPLLNPDGHLLQRKEIYMAKGGSMSLLIKKELRMTVSMISHVPLS